MHYCKPTRDPFREMLFRQDRTHALLRNRRWVFMFLRHLSQLLKRCPHKPFVVGTCPRIVRTRLVDDRHTQLLTVGLRLSCYRNMHPVLLAVTIGIKCGFNPKIMLDPIRLERIDYLRFAIHEFWYRWFHRSSDGTKTANRKCK